MNDEPFSHRAGADVPEDVRRGVRRLVAGGAGGVVEADNFHEYENLERLELREGTREIGAKAFLGRRRLRRADFPSSLRTIGDQAFYGCSSLSETNLPEGLQRIGREAFIGHCFRQITIPSSVVDIGFGAFACGEVLSKVTLAGGMVMAEDKFRGCPSSLRTIGSCAFANCWSLSEMNLPEGLRRIEREAFIGHCFRKITIPSSVVEIEGAAFAMGEALNKVTLAGGMVMVARDAFVGCRQLRNIATPSEVIVVEDGEYGNGRAAVVSGGIALRREQEPTRLILSSPYLASMQSADVAKIKDAINRTLGCWLQGEVTGADQIRSRFHGLLSTISRIVGGRPPRGPLDLGAGDADDWIRVREGADRIRSRFLCLLSAHRRAIASILERAPSWESAGGGVDAGVVGIILSFLGDVEG